MKKPNILISVPNMSWVHKHVVFSLLVFQRDTRVNSKIILPTHVPYVNNLHHIIKDFLDGDYDYWINIDDDNPPRNNIIDLVFLDKDLIGCPTPVWHYSKPGDYPIYWNALDEVDGGFKPHKLCEGLQKVDAVGSGCFVVARRVIEALQYNLPFMRQWNEDGTVEVGGDFSFCQKIRKKGFEVWAHFNYPCYHFNEVELGEINIAFNSIREKENV